jgi:hypothetical protein
VDPCREAAIVAEVWPRRGHPIVAGGGSPRERTAHEYLSHVVAHQLCRFLRIFKNANRAPHHPDRHRDNRGRVVWREHTERLEVIESNRLPGIRRERAYLRKAPSGHPKIFKTAVEAKGRKIYLDVYQGSKQPYVTISEVGYSKDDKNAYTIIVYGDEIKGLHKAIEACVKKIDRS